MSPFYFESVSVECLVVPLKETKSKFFPAKSRGIGIGNHLIGTNQILAIMNYSTIFLMLKQHSILANLTEAQVDMLSKHTMLQTIKKGSPIYDHGDTSQYVYLVEKGSVKLGIHASCGKILIKDIIYENSVFGENVFLADNRRQEFAETMTDVNVLKIPVGIFKKMVEENGTFANDIMAIIITRLQMLEERMHSFVFKKAKVRIANFIKKTGDLKGIRIGVDECLINHGMSHKEIAYLTDTSRQTVARVLGDLKKANIIHFSARKPNKILIRDMAALM